MPLTQDALLQVWRPRPLACLCKKCEGVAKALDSRLSEGSRGTRFEHHKTLHDLTASADGGCALCGLFLSSFQGARPWPYKSEEPVQTGTVITSYEYQLYLYFPYEDGDLSYDEDERNQVEQLFLTYLVQAAPHEDLALDYDTPEPGTSTADALPLCKLWLQECRQSHNSCQYEADKYHVAGIPTRLIDISNPACPRLSLSIERASSTGGIVEYATLSHCWGKGGGANIATLTSSALNEFRELIPDAALPKTYRDAIHATWVLGFRYLWIDSLCIVQDSAEDWARESAMMSQVYRGASLNIAATSSKDAGPGAAGEAADGAAGGMREGTLYGLYPGTFDWISAKKDRLRRRAWVVQERFLSRRTLHLAQGQVFWECDEGPACETYPTGYPAAVFDENRLERWPGFGPDFSIRRARFSRELWPEIVRRYTRGRLTRETDMLVAIGGLARIMTEHFGGGGDGEEGGNQYVAGLWRERLEEQLCWSYAGPVRGRGRRIVPYTAPTWSWASLKGAEIAARIGCSQSELFVEVCDVRLTPYSSSGQPDAYGQLADATLRLRCRLLCPGSEIPGRGVRFDFSNKIIFCNTELDIQFGQKPLLYRSYYFLPVCRSPGPIRELEGLLLEPTWQKQGQYRRVGYFWVPWGAPSDDFQTEAEQQSLTASGAVKDVLDLSTFAMICENEHGEIQEYVDLV
ncbi:HET-domain-containing protein [Corynascus novoguineensis]|uniref:HET-domain-containing protein n=1 Tax=Corynascus novoguineensis TaxID=1126955 RepID=A0AAN7CKF6_9PEZI|nr:HET-domain-containing protein [Corynascus novoguineensis]